MIIEDFCGISDDMALMSLAYYFTELLDTYSSDDTGDADLLQLGLNSLYALSRKLYPASHVKSAFELRLMCLEGYSPGLDSCFICGKTDTSELTFSISEGICYCEACARSKNIPSRYISQDTYKAMKYICSSSPKKLLSFSAGDEKELSDICERYLLHKSERKFGTLDCYHQYINETD